MPADISQSSLSPSDWITLGIAIAGPLGGVIWWGWTRIVARIDSTHQSLHGEDGAIARCNKQIGDLKDRFASYVLTEDFDMQIEKLEGHLREMRRDGQAQEQRILEAIRESGNISREESRAVRQDVSEIHRRIDHIRDGRPIPARRN